MHTCADMDAHTCELPAYSQGSYHLESTCASPTYTGTSRRDHKHVMKEDIHGHEGLCVTRNTWTHMQMDQQVSACLSVASLLSLCP